MATNGRPNDIPLENLTDDGLKLADPKQDIRGRKVVDSSGVEVGHVSALFIDPGERKVRILEIHVGGVIGIGGHHVLVPIDAVVDVAPEVVRIGRTSDYVAHSPVYHPKLILRPERDYWSPYYNYYGYTPYWGDNYLEGREPR
jgi:sporulation protein YlmC with PRC-barrel domain